ncbi:unnamed protein product [Nyctereutes procyonoides]|uniref:(raccoon dog) hypothetical protein n=1 Tax=Nyctereutes procyonoides TaxID=34880 RepID=A0A811Y9N0_NYCPR|nr:unnamed protein product [Nyctereutes procyonoides]
MAEQEQRKKTPLVLENLLKKGNAYQALKATQAKQVLLDKKEQKKGKKLKFKQLEWFLHDSWWQQCDRVCLRCLEVKPCGLEVPDKHYLAFIVRITAENHCKAAPEDNFQWFLFQSNSPDHENTATKNRVGFLKEVGLPSCKVNASVSSFGS